MKRSYIYVVVPLILIVNVITIYSLSTQKANNMAGPANDQSVSVSRLSGELGDRHSCFFTVEERWKDGGLMNRILGQRVQRPPKGRDVSEDLKALSLLIPDMTYKVDEANPKIIHIMEASLANQQGYALDRVVDHIDFSGTVFELVQALEKQGIRVSSRGTVGTHDLSSMDFSTQVHVQGKQLRVRGILSDFLPLQDRNNRILWVARTKMGSGEVSFIRFYISSLPTEAAAQ